MPARSRRWQRGSVQWLSSAGQQLSISAPRPLQRSLVASLQCHGFDRGSMNTRALNQPGASVGVGALLGAIAFTLGLVRIGSKSLWFDEAVSADFADRSFADLLPEITGRDPNMSLYYLLLNLWRRLFGDS